jgi:hypothetical protein
MMPKHKQVHIRYGDIEADIDERIAPLILELWKADIVTALSCQNNNNRIWIEFLSARDAEKFLNIVGAVYERAPESLYNRITNVWVPENERRWLNKFWEYDAHPTDWSVSQNGEHEERDSEVDFSFSISIRFPKSDLAIITERVTAYNSAHKQSEDPDA